jgi:uncharacterized membrane protein
VQFSPTIGGAVGVGVMGGVLTAFVGAASFAILDPVARGTVSTQAAAARDSLSAGLDVTYLLMFAAAALACLLAIATMPDVALGHELAAGAGGRAD